MGMGFSSGTSALLQRSEHLLQIDAGSAVGPFEPMGGARPIASPEGLLRGPAAVLQTCGNGTADQCCLRTAHRRDGLQPSASISAGGRGRRRWTPCIPLEKPTLATTADIAPQLWVFPLGNPEGHP